MTLPVELVQNRQQGGKQSAIVGQVGWFYDAMPINAVMGVFPVVVRECLPVALSIDASKWKVAGDFVPVFLNHRTDAGESFEITDLVWFSDGQELLYDRLEFLCNLYEADQVGWSVEKARHRP